MKKTKGRTAMRVVMILLAAALAAECLLAFAVYGTTLKTYPEAKADAIIVLGARVYPDGRLSLTLERRTKKAFEAYEKGLSDRFIVCGGQGSDEPTTEASAMASQLMRWGVPEDAIFLEDQSTNTRENLQNAESIMRDQGMRDALLVTSDYHLTRALWISRDVGVQTAGLPSKGPDTRSMQVKAVMQEAVSWIKYALTRS